jgi:hypothetical protein
MPATFDVMWSDRSGWLVRRGEEWRRITVVHLGANATDHDLSAALERTFGREAFGAGIRRVSDDRGRP